jgi:hypothetical protein
MYLDSLNQNGENPTVKAKNQAFWTNLKLRLANIPELSRNVICVKADILSDSQKKKIEEFDTINITTWSALAEWARSTKRLSLVERKRIDHTISYLNSGKDIIFDHVRSCMDILEKAKDLGFTEN